MYLPKFSISGSYNLDQILPKLGITDLFFQQVDLSGITDQLNLWVSKVIHPWLSTPGHLGGELLPLGRCWVLDALPVTM